MPRKLKGFLNGFKNLEKGSTSVPKKKRTRAVHLVAKIKANKANAKSHLSDLDKAAAEYKALKSTSTQNPNKGMNIHHAKKSKHLPPILRRYFDTDEKD